MPKRTPFWIRALAGAAFVYAWVLIAYTPTKHKSALLKHDDSKKLYSRVDDIAVVTSNYETILEDPAIDMDKPNIAIDSKAVPTSDPFPIDAVLLVDEEESVKEKPTTKKSEVIIVNPNVPDKQLDGTRSDGKQDVSAGKESQVESPSSKIPSGKQESSQINKSELSNTKNTDHSEVVPKVKETEKTSPNVPSDRLDQSVVISKNESLSAKDSDQTATVQEVTKSANIPPATSEKKPTQDNPESDNYPKPHSVPILAPGVCPPGDVVTIVGGGRLANCIWEYVTVWSLSKFLPSNRAPFAQKLIVDTLRNVFDGIDLPTVEDIPRDCECCKSTNWTATNVHVFDFIPLNNVTNRFADFKGHIILSKYSLLLEPVLATIEELKTLFIYKDELISSAHNIIRNKTELYMKSNKVADNTKIVYVGVHVRRTDYIKYLSVTHNMTVTGPEYFIAAINYFRKRSDLGKPIFLVVSDDIPWVEQNLQGSDVFTASRGGIDNPGYDIALLSHCNHSIIDYGTYGLWAAVYAGGETVTLKTTTQIHRILSGRSNWHFVKTAPPGEIVIP